MAETKFEVHTAYHSISSAENDMSDLGSDRPKLELGAHPQVRENRSWWATLLWQTFTVLWLVPVVALLYLNFSHYVIGASAWCPDGKCYLNAFNWDGAVPQKNMKGFDKEDHNLLGGLQFVAKGLEIWFGIIAAALIYLITMIFAGKREGLPVGYLTRPMEFADVIALLDPLLWVTGPSPFGAKSAGEKRLGRRVWMLVGLSVFLCILINLMGPATAVLVIPSLQWIETANVGSRQFSHLNAGLPPRIGFEGWVWWASGLQCGEHHFRTQNFTCNLPIFGNALDTWISSALSGLSGSTGFTTQSGLTFTTNYTSQHKSQNSLQQLHEYNKAEQFVSDVVFWAPSRQIVSNLSIDLDAVGYLSLGLNEQHITNKLSIWADPIETYTEYNKSLELQIRRNGPVIGTVITKYVTYNDFGAYTIDVDAGRKIRCYKWYDLTYAPLAYGASSGSYTKCIRIGEGWSKTNKHTSFYVPGAFDPLSQTQGSDVAVDVYSSDRAVFLPNGTHPSWLPGACLYRYGKLNKTDCDWDRLFTTDATSDIANRTRNVNTIEYRMQTGNFSTMLAVDFVAFEAFTEYTLDPYPFSNPLGLVQTADLPSGGSSFPIDPAWLLAGFSVGPGGALGSNRTITNLILDTLVRLSQNPDENVILGLAEGDYKLDYISFLPIMHTLSMIDHSTTFVAEGTKSNDPAKPLLMRNARMFVWAYGLGSRTSYLGAAVAIAGVIVVIWQFLLGFMDRRRLRSPTQLLVAALEHCPKGEFEGKQHDEKAMARVRFHIKDDSGHSGKYSFFEPQASDDHIS